MNKLSLEEKARRKRIREAKELMWGSISLLVIGLAIYFLVPHKWGSEYGGVGSVITGSIALILFGVVLGIVALVLRFKKVCP